MIPFSGRDCMRFLLRDDDTSYLTKPEELERAFGRYYSVMPISLAVIPWVDREFSTYECRQFSGNCCPLGENVELTRYLRDLIRNDQISIMLHGLSHNDIKLGTHEFCSSSPDLFERVRLGKEYLETTLDVKVMDFVPPCGSISTNGVEAVEQNRMGIIGSKPQPWNRKIEPALMAHIVKRAYFRMKMQVSNRASLAYPYIIRLGGHSELLCNPLSLSSSNDKFIENLHYCLSEDVVFAISTHYWEINRHDTVGKCLDEVFGIVANNIENVQLLRL